MSDTPVDQPAVKSRMGDRTPSASVSLVDYEDVSGEFIQKAAESPIDTEPTATEPTATEATVTEATATEATATEATATQPPTEKEVETESEAEEEKLEEDVDGDAAAVGMGSILVLGGMLLAGLAYFLNQPVSIDHPHTVRGYF